MAGRGMLRTYLNSPVMVVLVEKIIESLNIPKSGSDSTFGAMADGSEPHPVEPEEE
jgi:hypothetical protein